MYHFQATDADHGENARLNFTISKTEQNSSLDFFWIDSAKGVLQTKHELTDMGGGQFKVGFLFKTVFQLVYSVTIILNISW